MLDYTVLFCYGAEVSLDLGAHGVFPAPVWVEGEGVGVEMGGDLDDVSRLYFSYDVLFAWWWRCERTYITATSRICICQPCSSHVLTLFDEFEIVDPEFADDLDGET